MKKILIVTVCLLLIIISGCKNSVVTQDSNTQKISATSITVSADHSLLSKEENTTSTHALSISRTHISTSQPKSELNYENAPYPYDLYFSINTLKNLKAVAETANDQEFADYLERNKFDLVWCEAVNTVEKFNALLDDIQNTYIAVFDNETVGDANLIYHLDEKRIVQIVSFTENCRFVFDFYVSREPIYLYSTVIDTEYVTSVENNSVKADIHQSESREGFCVDAVFDGQKFTFRVTEEQTIEEFEETFSRLEFVKIGDLINS